MNRVDKIIDLLDRGGEFTVVDGMRGLSPEESDKLIEEFLSSGREREFLEYSRLFHDTPYREATAGTANARLTRKYIDRAKAAFLGNLSDSPREKRYDWAARGPGVVKGTGMDFVTDNLLYPSPSVSPSLLKSVGLERNEYPSRTVKDSGLASLGRLTGMRFGHSSFPQDYPYVPEAVLKWEDLSSTAKDVYSSYLYEGQKERYADAGRAEDDLGVMKDPLPLPEISLDHVIRNYVMTRDVDLWNVATVLAERSIQEDLKGKAQEYLRDSSSRGSFIKSVRESEGLFTDVRQPAYEVTPEEPLMSFYDDVDGMRAVLEVRKAFPGDKDKFRDVGGLTRWINFYKVMKVLGTAHKSRDYAAMAWQL